MLPREIKENLNKQRNVPYLWARIITFKSLADLFSVDTNKPILKFRWEVYETKYSRKFKDP